MSSALSRLPEVLAAVQRGETIYIPEGEKDVDNLVQLGLVATTNSGGAGKWETRFADYLAGVEVVILPDNDESGRKHADQVARSLKGKAKSIKVVELPGLPDKGDVSDWLAKGGTKEELLRLVANVPALQEQQSKELFEPVTVRLSDVEPEAVSWLWEPYIPQGKLTMFEGDPGLGKTWAALAITAITTTTGAFITEDGCPGPVGDPANVIYMTAEDGLADTLRPRLDAAGADVSRVIALTGFMSYDAETNERRECPVSMQNLIVLDRALEQHHPALLVIDPLQAYLGAGVDMHRANEVRPVLAGIASLAEKHKCAILLIRHIGKSQMDRAIYRGLGSIDFTAAARSVLLAGQDTQNPFKRAIIQTKNSLAPLGPSIGYELRDGQFFWTGISDLTAGQVLQADRFKDADSKLEIAKDFLTDYLADGPRSAKEALRDAEDAGIRFPTFKRAKQALEIESYQEPGKRGNWFYRLPQSVDQDASADQSSLYSHDDPLIQRPETIAAQRIGEFQSVDHVIQRLKTLDTLQGKGSSDYQSVDQENVYRESDQILIDDPVNDLLEVRI